jgi:shikimate kinase
MSDNIILVGFMGTGKTVVGRRLAAKLDKKFVDTDMEIERVTGMPVARLIKKHGEIRFRSEETLALKRISKLDNIVVATGGGIVLNKENVDLLKNMGKIICLTAAPEIIKERIERRNNRPLLGKDTSIEKIKELLSQSEEFYKEADFVVDTTDLQIDDVINKIFEFLQNADLK